MTMHTAACATCSGVHVKLPDAAAPHSTPVRWQGLGMVRLGCWYWGGAGVDSMGGGGQKTRRPQRRQPAAAGRTPDERDPGDGLHELQPNLPDVGFLVGSLHAKQLGIALEAQEDILLLALGLGPGALGSHDARA